MKQRTDEPDDHEMIPDTATSPKVPHDHPLLTLDELHTWLCSPHDDTRVSQLQVLMAYIIKLAGDATPAVPYSMLRVLTHIRADLDQPSELDRLLRFSYCTCFKCLVYLELHDISFDAALVLDVVRWKTAYQTIAYMCCDYLVYQCGRESNMLHDLCSNTPKAIDVDAATVLLADLKNMACQTVDWNTSFEPSSKKLYGPKLQSSPTIAAAKAAAAKGAVPWSHLDTRVPNGPADDTQESITLILAHVSAIDKVLGVTREAAEWTSLREFLTLYRFCDEDGDMLHRRSIHWRCESYGILTPAFEDVLTPIGFETVFLDCNPFFEPYQVRDTDFKSFEHIDPYTLRLERRNGDVEFIAFTCDVSYARLTRDVACVMTNGKQMSINFQRRSVIDARDNDRLHNITMAIKDKVLGEVTVEPPYPSPRGVGAVAHALLRPWGAWRGVDVVDGAVAIASFTALQRYVEDAKSGRGELVASCWDGIVMDVEVIALSRAIPERPSSFVATAYLAHVCAADMFEWDHLSSCAGIEVGAPGLVPLFSVDDAEDLVSCEMRRSRDALSWHGMLGERDGYLVVQAGWPRDIAILFLSLLMACVLPELAANNPPTHALRDMLRNTGTILAPLLALYLVTHHHGQDIRLLISGQRIARSLDEAAALTGQTKEQLCTALKHSALAERVLQPTGNSVALSGDEPGCGRTSVGHGLRATRLVDAGALFLARQDSDDVAGMVDVGGFLRLVRDPVCNGWRAEASDMELGVWRVLSRKEVAGVIIS